MMLLASSWALETRADSRSPAKKIMHLLYAPKPAKYRNDKHYLYKNYVVQGDGQIQSDYQKNWAFHESIVRYHSTSWKHEYFEMGTMNTLGNAPHEGEVRQLLAQKVLRVRFQNGVDKFLESFAYSKNIKQAQQAIKKINSMPIFGSNANPTSGKLTLGYDIFTDASKVEYVMGKTTAGLYYPHLLESLTGGPSASAQVLTFRLRTPLGRNLPMASLDYVFGQGTLATGLHHTLSPGLSASIINTRPITGNSTSPDSYWVYLSYWF